MVFLTKGIDNIKQTWKKSQKQDQSKYPVELEGVDAGLMSMSLWMDQEQLSANVNTLQMFMEKEHHTNAKTLAVTVNLFIVHILVAVEIQHMHIL